QTMLKLTLNGEAQTLPEPLTVANLIDRLGYDRRRIAVEVNREVVPVAQQPAHRLASGDAVEIVTLVGGGAAEPQALADKPRGVAKPSFHSRLIPGAGK